VSQTFSSLKINISEANCRAGDDGRACNVFAFQVADLAQLKSVMKALSRNRGGGAGRPRVSPPAGEARARVGSPGVAGARARAGAGVAGGRGVAGSRSNSGARRATAGRRPCEGSRRDRVVDFMGPSGPTKPVHRALRSAGTLSGGGGFARD
jgi:hypothetical protein